MYGWTEAERMNSKRHNKAPDDAELMTRVACGDEGALSTLYYRYGGEVSLFVHSLAPGLSDPRVEELVQDVFLTVYNKASAYEERGKLKAWLFGIAARLARRAGRRHWLQNALLRRRGREIEAAMGHGPVANPERNLIARAGLAKALDALPDKYRQVILLHAQGFRGTEIAKILGLRRNTVWTRLHRGRRMIKDSAGELEGWLCKTG